jgi:hypothetical protein
MSIKVELPRFNSKFHLMITNKNLVRQSAIPLSKWKARQFVPYVQRPPKPFRLIEPLHPRAIVIPWLSSAIRWQEICFSLRSIERFWTDKECPIYIIGDKAPVFLKDGGRVRFIHIKEYEESNEAGLWEAWQIGMQIADEVAWWNDDIYLLKDTGWDDLRIALEEGDLAPEVDKLRMSFNTWQQAMGESVAEMLRQGRKEVRRFATHTPFLFGRLKSLEIFRTYHLHHKGSWVNLYHNHHQTPHTPCKPHKTMSLPPQNGERFYNHRHSGPDLKSKKILEEMFSNKASWEL